MNDEPDSETAVEPALTAAPQIALTPVTPQQHPNHGRVQALRAWLDEHLKNSPVSRDTPTWNAVHRLVGEIERALFSMKE